jgi:prepilin-type N-terminal cleavage/methylation domain-containing protein
MSRRSAKPGFTLLEVVLAVTLALMLMAAMLTFYKQAADVRAAALDDVRLMSAERAVMDLATQELRSAFVYRFLGFGLEGSASEMRLVTVTFPSGGMWIAQKMTDVDKLPREAGMQIVGYRLRYSEDEEGRPVVDGLERTCQRTPTARISEQGKEIEAALLAPDIKFLRLRYWDGSAWVEAWGGGGLPQAVEIVLGREPLPTNVEPSQYPYPTFRRVVALPAAPRSSPGGAGRSASEESGT